MAKKVTTLNDNHRLIYDTICNGSKMTILKIHQETNLKPMLIGDCVHYMKSQGLLAQRTISGKERYYYMPTDMTYEELDERLNQLNEELNPKVDELLEMVSTFTLTKQQYEFYRANIARLSRSKIAKQLGISKLDFNAGIENYEKKMKGSK